MKEPLADARLKEEGGVMTSLQRAVVINNAILGATATALTLGLYAMGAGAWAGFGMLPIIGMAYWSDNGKSSSSDAKRSGSK